MALTNRDRARIEAAIRAAEMGPEECVLPAQVIRISRSYMQSWVIAPLQQILADNPRKE